MFVLLHEQQKTKLNRFLLLTCWSIQPQMKRKQMISATFAITLLFSITLGTPINVCAEELASLRSMPEEYINYTITRIDGDVWAKIDGTYPIYNSGTEEVLPMVYPTPPSTTNIRIWLDGVEQSWSNYTEVLHHAGIGDWEMILSVLEPASDFFVLRIHYEHPVQVINGSSMFLYDLNIAPYLSASANKSLAQFTILMNINFTDLSVNTMSVEDEKLKPIDYSETDGNPKEIKVTMFSEFGKPLLDDLLFSFKTADSEATVDSGDSFWFFVLATVSVLAVADLAAFLILRRTIRKIATSQSTA